jgi:methylase of polypeptide subunit release factors
MSAERTAPSAERQELGPMIVELCTGSGAVAIALATELPMARLLATDVSWRALRVARVNAERHGVAQRITFLRGDLCMPWWPGAGRFGGSVVVNPRTSHGGAGDAHAPVQ